MDTLNLINDKKQREITIMFLLINDKGDSC